MAIKLQFLKLKEEQNEINQESELLRQDVPESRLPGLRRFMSTTDRVHNQIDNVLHGGVDARKEKLRQRQDAVRRLRRQKANLIQHARRQLETGIQADNARKRGLPPGRQSHDIIFNARPLGFTRPADGSWTVKTVVPGQEAARLGVLSGWIVFKVEDTSDENLYAFQLSSLPLPITCTFWIPDTISTSMFIKGQTVKVIEHLQSRGVEQRVGTTGKILQVNSSLAICVRWKNGKTMWLSKKHFRKLLISAEPAEGGSEQTNINTLNVPAFNNVDSFITEQTGSQRSSVIPDLEDQMTFSEGSRAPNRKLTSRESNMNRITGETPKKTKIKRAGSVIEGSDQRQVKVTITINSCDKLPKMGGEGSKISCYVEFRWDDAESVGTKWLAPVRTKPQRINRHPTFSETFTHVYDNQQDLANLTFEVWASVKNDDKHDMIGECSANMRSEFDENFRDIINEGPIELEQPISHPDNPGKTYGSLTLTLELQYDQGAMSSSKGVSLEGGMPDTLPMEMKMDERGEGSYSLGKQDTAFSVTFTGMSRKIISNELQERIRIGTLYIKDAMKARSVQHLQTANGKSPESIKLYDFLKSHGFERFSLFMALTQLIIVTYIETSWDMSPWYFAAADGIFILFYTLEFWWKYKCGIACSERSSFYRDVFILVFCFLDCTKGLIWPSPLRITRIARPYFVAQRNDFVKDTYSHIRNSFVDIANLILLLFILITFFSAVAFTFWHRIEGHQSKEYGTIYQSFLNLFVLMTTDNFPDVMLSQYKVSRWSSWFYLVFFIVVYMFAANLVLASLNQSYEQNMRDQIEHKFTRVDQALNEAFIFLCDPKTMEIGKVTFEELIHMIRPDMSMQRCDFLFDTIDTDGSGAISTEEFELLLGVLGLNSINDEENVHDFSGVAADPLVHTETSRGMNYRPRDPTMVKGLKEWLEDPMAWECAMFVPSCCASQAVLDRRKTTRQEIMMIKFGDDDDDTDDALLKHSGTKHNQKVTKLSDMKETAPTTWTMADLLERVVLYTLLLNVLAGIYSAQEFELNNTTGATEWGADQWPWWMSLLEMVTVVVLVFEFVIKILAEGLRGYWDCNKNIFDGLLTTLAVVHLINPLPNYQFIIHSCGFVLRLLRVFSLLSDLKTFRQLTHTAVRVLNAYLPILFSLFLVMYIYIIFGVEFFSKKLGGTPETARLLCTTWIPPPGTSMTETMCLSTPQLCSCQAGSEFAESGYVGIVTFDTFQEAFAVLMGVLLVNNWWQIVDACVRVTSPVTYIYFVTFYIIGVVYFFNLVIAVTIQAFTVLAEIEDKSGEKEADKVSTHMLFMGGGSKDQELNILKYQNVEIYSF